MPPSDSVSEAPAALPSLAPARPPALTAPIATPAGKPGGLAGLASGQALPYFGARLGIALARAWGGAVRLGTKVIATRHADVSDALARDLDFLIQPVNAAKFDSIGYHFILGMDRSGELIVERKLLYAALSAVDMGALQAAVAADISHRLDVHGDGPLDIIEDFARPIAAATASRLFGLAPETPEEWAHFMDAARAIFGNSFLNLGGDTAMTQRALVAADMLTGWFDREIARRRSAAANGGGLGDDMMGTLLREGASDDLTRRTLGGMLVGAIDTTASSVAKVISVLVGDKALLARAQADTGDLTRMWGWCNEALRRWPHGPLLLRKAAADTTLAGASVKAGDTVILWTEAAMLDAAAFPDPTTLRPDRPNAPYLHLGGGLHPCAGRGINAWQIPMLVAALLDRQPTRLGRIAWAGPFPAHLKVSFKGLGA